MFRVTVRRKRRRRRSTFHPAWWSVCVCVCVCECECVCVCVWVCVCVCVCVCECEEQRGDDCCRSPYLKLKLLLICPQLLPPTVGPRWWQAELHVLKSINHYEIKSYLSKSTVISQHDKFKHVFYYRYITLLSVKLLFKLYFNMFSCKVTRNWSCQIKVKQNFTSISLWDLIQQQTKDGGYN